MAEVVGCILNRNFSERVLVCKPSDKMLSASYSKQIAAIENFNT